MHKVSKGRLQKMTGDMQVMTMSSSCTILSNRVMQLQLFSKSCWDLHSLHGYYMDLTSIKGLYWCSASATENKPKCNKLWTVELNLQRGGEGGPSSFLLI